MHRLSRRSRPLAVTLLFAALALALVACSPRQSVYEQDSATPNTPVEPIVAKVPDADGDSVPDSADLCPARKEDRRWSAGTDGCPDTIDDLIAFATRDIDAFWERVFEDQGDDYASPTRVVGYSGRERTSCGASVPDNAFYCPHDNSIYFDESLFADALTSFGDFAPVFILAHEWGHLVQQQLGILSNPRRQGIQNELQADCFAGFYTKDAESRKLLEAGDVDEAKMMAIAAGDRSGARRSADSHGTSKQRAASFQSGYTGGLDACMAI